MFSYAIYLIKQLGLLENKCYLKLKTALSDVPNTTLSKNKAS